MANRRRRGFTLIDGLVGATILSLVVTATFGSWTLMFRHNLQSHWVGEAAQLARAEAERAKLFGADGIPLGTYDTSSGKGVWTGAYDPSANSGAGAWVAGAITYYDARGNALAGASSPGAVLAIQDRILDSDVLLTTGGGYRLQPSSQREVLVTTTLVDDGSTPFALATTLVEGGL